jgi:hypothetical protein
MLAYLVTCVLRPPLELIGLRALPPGHHEHRDDAWGAGDVLRAQPRVVDEGNETGCRLRSSVELESECSEGSSDLSDRVEVARVGGAPNSKVVRAWVRAV